MLCCHLWLRVTTQPIDTWIDEDGVQQTEVADGGTTATVIALIDGATLVHAQVTRWLW